MPGRRYCQTAPKVSVLIYRLCEYTTNTKHRCFLAALKVHASGQFKTVIDKLGGYVMEPRGNVYMKVGVTGHVRDGAAGQRLYEGRCDGPCT